MSFLLPNIEGDDELEVVLFETFTRHSVEALAEVSEASGGICKQAIRFRFPQSLMFVKGV
jgi:hypothetical protein